jgi:hypothetical protein
VFRIASVCRPTTSIVFPASRSASVSHRVLLTPGGVIENHYKDDYWQYPEFAQAMDVFCELVERIGSPHFGVNYGPSNTLLAGEDPLEDLRREETSVGYARRLRHGEIGKGMRRFWPDR